MSDDATPRLALPYLAAGQAQKHLTVNEALAALDGLVQTAVESRTTAAQPSAAADGAMYILPSGRTGAEWSLFPAGSLVRFEVGGWTRLPAAAGTLAYAQDEARLLVHDGAGWVELAQALKALQNLERLGVGTTADAVNPLAARLNKALFTALGATEGGDGDLRLTLNKESAADVLSLLFQTGFSGRAELGLVGDDALTLKTSTDGAAWATVFAADGAGRLRLPSQPAFGAFLSAERTTPGAFAGFEPLGFSLNRGGCFDAASGVFTAPVAGAYAFQLVGKSGAAAAARGVFSLRVNGVSIGEAAETYAPYQDVGAALLLSLPAGAAVTAGADYLEAGQPVSVFLSGWLVG